MDASVPYLQTFVMDRPAAPPHEGGREYQDLAFGDH